MARTVERQGPPGLRGAIEAQLDAMSSRDKKLLTGLVAFAFAAIAFVTYMFVSSILEDRQARLRSLQDDLDYVTVMAETYQETSAAVAKNEERLRQFSGKSVSAFVEEVAREVGVSEQLQAVNEQGSETVGNLRQTKYKVELKKVTLEQAASFLWEVETRGYPVAVSLARMKTVTTQGEKQLDVTLELVGYTLEGA